MGCCRLLCSAVTSLHPLSNLGRLKLVETVGCGEGITNTVPLAWSERVQVRD